MCPKCQVTWVFPNLIQTLRSDDFIHKTLSIFQNNPSKTPPKMRFKVQKWPKIDFWRGLRLDISPRRGIFSRGIFLVKNGLKIPRSGIFFAWDFDRIWAFCGIYTTPLPHGRVVFFEKCELAWYFLHKLAFCSLFFSLDFLYLAMLAHL